MEVIPSGRAGCQAEAVLTGVFFFRIITGSVHFNQFVGTRNLKFIALIMSFALLVQFNLLILPTYADSVTVTTTTTTTPGGITGQVPVTKVGALIAGDCLAILSGTEIKIESKSKSHNANSTSTPPNNLLTGVLMQTKTVGTGASGYAVFNGGDRFNRISSTGCPDKVTTTTGAVYTGSITSATASAVSMSTSSGSQTINSSDIADIHSARAFKYNIPDTGAPKMSFTTTCVHSVATTTKSSDHGNTTKKLIIVGLALTIVAVAIAVPVAVACSSHHHSNNNNNIIAANLLAARARAVPQPTLPSQLQMPTALTPQQLGRNYVASLQNLKSSNSSSVSSSSSSSSGGQFVTTPGGTFFSP